jgi:uncharacterized protein
MTALSPVHTIGNQIREAILLHQDVTWQEADAIAAEMLGIVGIPGAAKRLRQYPFEMSGGMRQRVVIAMTLACRPELLIACDLLANQFYLCEYDLPRLRWMVFGAVAGIGVGTWVFWNLRGMPPESFSRLLNLMVGILCMAIVALQIYRLFGREVPTLPSHPASGVTVGLVAGALSTMNHAAGPITTLYLMQGKLQKRQLVGTLLLYTLIGNTAKLPTFLLMPMPSGQSLINAATLRDSIWFIPLIPLGTIAGAWMNRKVPDKPFTAIMYIAAAVMAVQMVYKSM